MSSDRLELPGINMDEEVEITVGNVQYLLVLDKVNVLP